MTTLNQSVLKNLYAELNLAILHHERTEQEYLESCARMNLLNEEIIAQKKLIVLENEK